jgi:ribosome biogenesis GTPase
VERVASGVPVHRVSIVDGQGVESVRSRIGRGRTAALVGSSGVGKSSLINAILELDLLKVGAVRAGDGRGRHTTTHRQLLLVPDGGVIIDTPGMRELQLWGDEGGAGATFGDIDELAGQCRFRDCSHQGEPGCRVRLAVESGELHSERLASFRKQHAELRWLASQEDPLVRAEEKSRWKAIHKAARKHMTRKYGE